MGVKRGLKSSSIEFAEPTPSKSNKPLLGGDKNPSIEEQWIIPKTICLIKVLIGI